jgi:hypothetical protein
VNNKDRRNPMKGWGQQLYSLTRPSVRWVEPALILVFILLIALPVTDKPSIVMLRARRAQELVDQLRIALPIPSQVDLAVVVYHPLVFSVEPLDKQKDHFVLSMELGFLLRLDDDELRAALAHELGHVWIFTHHPFLQTERLANTIGERVVNWDYFERLYSKLWAYERTSGVAINDLLGPRPGSSVSLQVSPGIPPVSPTP